MVLGKEVGLFGRQEGGWFGAETERGKVPDDVGLQALKEA